VTTPPNRFVSELCGVGEGDDGWDALAGEWDELADRVGASPFLRPAWFDLWQRSFGDSTARVLVLRGSGRVAGVLPLRGRGRVVESMANDHTPAFEPLAEDEDASIELARALFALRPRRLTLEYLDAEGTGIRALRAVAARRRYLVVVRDWERPPYIALDRSWRAYEGSLDAKLRRDLARRRRRLDECGAVILEVSDGKTGLARLLEEGFALEPSGWKDARGTAIRSQPETVAFYTGLARWASEHGMLRLSFLRLDGRPLAFQLGLEDRGSYYFVKGGYDAAFTRFAPAKLLVHDLVARAFEQRLTRFEFLGPPERFKLEWTSTCHRLERFQAYAHTPDALVAWAATAYGRPAAQAARSLLHRAQQLRAKTEAYMKPPHS